MSLKATIDDLRKYRGLILVIFIFCMVSTLSFLATGNMSESSAASLSNFNPGNIISDAVMGNYNSMTKDAIQQFLTKKNPCNNTNAAQYQSLKAQYPHLSWHFENGHFVCLSEEKFGDGNTIGQGQTAAEIIYQAAQDYKINPQVLLVLLEKEQSLITDTYPNSRQYQSATGYGCPDTAACDSQYYGFKNQVRNAAALFRNVLDKGYSAYPEKTKGVYVSYNPNSSCGRSEVYIENRATAALYRYTPYQPNAAALSAGYGSGDSCSAYGNRNFYLYFTDWFGSTQMTVSGDTVILPDGEYGFTSKLSANEVIEVEGRLTANGSTIQVWNKATSGSQRWKLTRDTNTNYYTITDLNSGKYLSIDDTGSLAGARVRLSDAKGCQSQWKIYRTSDNYLTFETVCGSGMVLEVSDGKAQDGADLQLALTNAGNAQKFAIYTGQSVKDGVYGIVSSNDKKHGFDIAEARSNNGGNIHTWDYLGYYNQNWRITYYANGDYYLITNPYSGLNVDISSASYAAGTNIQIWENNSTDAQRWKLIKTTDGYYTFTSAHDYRYSITLSNVANGGNIQLGNNNNSKNQKWSFIAATQGPVEDGIYAIASKGSNQTTFDIVEARSNNGANVYLWNRYGYYNQLWRLTYNASTKTYTITNPHSGKNLDISSGLMANNNNVQIWEDNGTCAQRWKIERQSDGYYTIQSACDNKFVLDLANSSMKPGSNLLIQTANGKDSQKFQFLR